MAERHADVTLHVSIDDPQALWRRAHATYEETNGTADQSDLEDMIGTEQEPDLPGCLRMILDPGLSPDGITINDSTVEVY